jgi:hypothetical protein
MPKVWGPQDMVPDLQLEGVRSADLGLANIAMDRCNPPLETHLSTCLGLVQCIRRDICESK